MKVTGRQPNKQTIESFASKINVKREKNMKEERKSSTTIFLFRQTKAMSSLS